ncbi:DUF1080 domain-containing protein [Armatimonas sp.]|uniref:3-keto-disaccharide hydrolase n=1 Tax=Armatimonas sp. TaxID=1872638 RepID=UPI002869F173|nr:DUF1080 domain-containing protein [Armatimonas sp.]
MRELILLAALLAAPTTAQKPVAIFNGRDLSGWQVPDPNPYWRVEKGVLIGENDEKKKGHVLRTEKSYKDFVLELDVRWSGEIDSGVMLRKPEIQLQFGISRSLKVDMTGAFYVGKYPEEGRTKDLDKTFKPNDWNRFKLEAKGDTFTVWCNGKQVSQFKDAKYAEAAPIGLQVHPGLTMKVEYRNIKLRVLDKPEVPVQTTSR